MSFKLVVEGEDGPEVVHEIEEGRVVRVSFGSKTGGAGEIRIDPDQTEVWVAFELANPNQLFLSDVEAMQHPTNVDEGQAEEIQKKLEEAGRPTTNEGTDQFTPEAVEEREKAAKEAEEAKETEAQRSADDKTPTKTGTNPGSSNKPSQSKTDKETAKA